MDAGGGRGQRAVVGDAPDAGGVAEQLVRARLDAVRDVAVGGAAVGVITMPSARPSLPALPAPRAALNVMIARDSAGVGVYWPSAWTRVWTPLLASTSSAVRSAGAEAAWVSAPRNSGPVIPARERYSQIAWVMARMCASLKALSSAAPRWPLVPKATRSRGLAGSGRRS